MSFFNQPSKPKPNIILRLEPPYTSSGDCGYRAIILGLFYLAENAELKSPLENKILGSILNSIPMVQKLLKSAPKPITTNAGILNALLASKVSTDELYNELTLALRMVALKSKWLDTQIIESLQTGLWIQTDFSSYQSIPAIKQLEKKQEQEMNKISFSREVKEEDIDSIRQEAWATVFKRLGEQEKKALIAAIKKHMYTKDVWVDAIFLQELTSEILESANILFDYKSNTTHILIGPGSNESHFYINIPDGEPAKRLVERGLCIVDARLSMDSKDENLQEKLQQKIVEFKRCVGYFNDQFGMREEVNLYKIIPGKSSSNEITSIMGELIDTIFQTPAHQNQFTKLCHLADEIIQLQKQIDAKQSVPESPPAGLPPESLPNILLQEKLLEFKEMIHYFEENFGSSENLLLLKNIIPGESKGEDIEEIMEDAESIIGNDKFKKLCILANELVALKAEVEAKQSHTTPPLGEAPASNPRQR